MKILELIKRTTEFFEKKGVPNAKLDAELLIAYILRTQRLQLYLQFEREVEEPTLEKLRPLVKRRGDREPLQYIIGQVEWGGIKLKVDRRCLVPRNETEELWDHIVQEYKVMGGNPRAILDLGTGSGALALALKKSYPAARVSAVEKDPQTLSLALENAQALNLEVDFHEGSWCQGLPKDARYDLIVSNPPYLTEEEMKSVKPEVDVWEPKGALTAPDGGFADLSEVIKQAKGHLAEGGQLWLEMGVAHAGRVKDLAKELGYSKAEIFKDHRERNRFAKLIA